MPKVFIEVCLFWLGPNTNCLSPELCKLHNFSSVLTCAVAILCQTPGVSHKIIGPRSWLSIKGEFPWKLLGFPLWGFPSWQLCPSNSSHSCIFNLWSLPLPTSRTTLPCTVAWPGKCFQWENLGQCGTVIMGWPNNAYFRSAIYVILQNLLRSSALFAYIYFLG